MYVHIYTHIYTHVCTHVRPYICTYICTYIYTYVYTYIYTYMHTHVCAGETHEAKVRELTASQESERKLELEVYIYLPIYTIYT